jgi:molybdate transport system substrate-binding protein
MVLRFWIAIGLGLVPLASPEGQSPVRIFAAASLTEALLETIEVFHSKPGHGSGIRVIPQFGASSDLARQILAGAPAHLFFSADEKQMERLVAEKAIERASRTDLLSNHLVIVVPREGSSAVSSPEDLEQVSRIAFADPQAVPAGVYARQYLEARGLWERLKTRVVPTLDVRAALAAVAAGNVEAAFVYSTDAKIEPRVRVAFEVPAGEGPRIRYPLGLVSGSDEGARAFFRFLQSSEAAAVFTRYGFAVIGSEE